MKKILVVGSLNMDLVFNVIKLPQKGETIMGKSFETFSGGKGANQAFTMGQLGADVEMMGMVGEDAYGIELIKNLRDHAIKTNNIGISLKPSGTANITVDQNGDNTIIVTPSANFDYSSKFIEKIKLAINNCDYLVLQLEIPYKVVKELILYAHSLNKIIIFNPAPARLLDDDILKLVDYLVPNETELQIISQKHFEVNYDNALEAAREFKKSKQIKNLIVTLGKQGSFIIDQSNKTTFIPIQKVKAIDSTGAGDSYVGAFVYSISMGNDAITALNFASKVSAIVVTKQGAQATPTLKEITDFRFDNTTK